MKKYLVFFSVSIFFLCCSEKDEIVIDDSELTTEIMGTWENDKYRITFLPNLTFIDTVLYIDSKSHLLETFYSRSGKFEIHDGILFLKTEHWDLFNNDENGISIVPIHAQISIKGNVLYKKSVDVLECTEGSKTTIWGSWKSVRWVYHTNPGAKITYAGREEHYYVFSKDSAKVVYGWKYLDNTPFSNPEFRSEFKYQPPYLSLYGPSYYNMKVEFKFEKMFWFHDNPIVELYRQK